MKKRNRFYPFADLKEIFRYKLNRETCPQIVTNETSEIKINFVSACVNSYLFKH